MRPSDRECFQLVLPSEDDRFFVHLTQLRLDACFELFFGPHAYPAQQGLGPLAKERQEDVSYRTVNSVGRIEVVATQYFCSLAAQFIENSNRDCASSMTLWLCRNAELLNR